MNSTFTKIDEGEDFNEPAAASLNLLFPVGSTNGQRQCVDDPDYELVQIFNVDMMTISPPIIPSAGPMAQVEISDNDGKPLLYPSHILHTIYFVSLCLQLQRPH